MRSKGNTDIKIQHKKANTNSISFQKIARFHKNEIQRQYRYITNNTWTPTQTHFHSTEITRYHKNEIQRQYWYKKKHKKANTNSISFQKIARYHKNVIQRQYRNIKKQHMNTYTNSLPLKKKITRYHKTEIQRQYWYNKNNTRKPTQIRSHSKK